MRNVAGQFDVSLFPWPVGHQKHRLALAGSLIASLMQQTKELISMPGTVECQEASGKFFKQVKPFKRKGIEKIRS